MNPRPVRVERIHHVPRELLRSRDFRDTLETDAQLQWWHQRAVHDPLGIVEGLSIDLATDTDFVVVAPGIAFDCFGRELQLFEPRVVPLPEEAVRMTLLARYPSGHEVHHVPAGHSRRDRQGQAELIWRETARVDARDGVPLARVNPKGSLEPESARPEARALARPRVGAGATPPDGTAWQPFDNPVVRRSFAGIEVRVDSLAAGFTDTPCYFAWLHWPRLASSTLPPWFVLALGFQHVERPSIDGFTFRVWLGPRAAINSGQQLVGFARNQQLFVSWLGIQAEDRTLGGPSARGKA